MVTLCVTPTHMDMKSMGPKSADTAGTVHMKLNRLAATNQNYTTSSRSSSRQLNNRQVENQAKEADFHLVLKKH